MRVGSAIRDLLPGDLTMEPRRSSAAARYLVLFGLASLATPGACRSAPAFPSAGAPAARLASTARVDIITAYARAVTAAPAALGLAVPAGMAEGDDDDAVRSVLLRLGASLDAVLSDALAAFNARSASFAAAARAAASAGGGEAEDTGAAETEAVEAAAAATELERRALERALVRDLGVRHAAALDVLRMATIKRFQKKIGTFKVMLARRRSSSCRRTQPARDRVPEEFAHTRPRRHGVETAALATDDRSRRRHVRFVRRARRFRRRSGSTWPRR